MGVVKVGAPGVPERYVYTGKKSVRSLHIAERAQSMHGCTRGEMLQMYYKDRNGVCVLYQERDMQYDAAQGYLQKEGGSQMAKMGVPRRGPVGSTRGRDGAVVGGWKRGKRQAAAPPQDRHQAERPAQAKKRGRESPVRTEKRARQWECLVTSTRVPRPAPDISKTMRPKSGDKEG
jgi:hypothetical protein